MAHIHTEQGQHDHTASAFIVRIDQAEPRLLLHKHKKLGMLLQPGGHIELHETPWQAVTREVREETGYELDQLQLLQPAARVKRLSVAKLHPVPVLHNTHAFDEHGDHYHTDIVYALVTNELPRHSVGAEESTDLRWLTRAELAVLTDKETYPDIHPVVEFIFDVCLPQWERLPATQVEL